MDIGICKRYLGIYSQNIQHMQAGMYATEKDGHSAPAQTEMRDGAKGDTVGTTLPAKEALKLWLTDRSVPRPLDVREAVRAGWKLFWEHPVPYIAWVLFCYIIKGFGSWAMQFLLYVESEDDEVMEKAFTRTAAGYTVFSMIVSVCVLVLIPLAFGPFIVASNSLRLNGYKLSDLFITPFKYSFPILLMGLLCACCCIFGLLLFIIPGLYLMFTLSMSMYVYMEYHNIGMGIMESMSLSVKVSHRVFFKIFLLMLASLLILLLGVLFFLVGVLVAVPVIFLTWAAAFHQVFSMNDAFDGRPRSCLCCC